MIFVTIGTQLPFDRLIKIVDELAPQLNEDVIAQVYHCGFTPQNIKTVDFLPPDQFNNFFINARLIISHAGIGTILSALQMDKPIIVFPRIAHLGEHRNEHQLATARTFKKLGTVYVAMNEVELRDLMLRNDHHPLQHISDRASESLIQSIESFIEA